MKKVWLVFLSALLALGMIACSKKSEEPAASAQSASVAPTAPDVVEIELGKSVDATKRVIDTTSDFRPMDTIYASVKTDGAAANSTVIARWTYGDSAQLVEETSHNIPAGGAAWTEFHISKPSGFPTGDYKVAIFVNGIEKANKDFAVN